MRWACVFLLSVGCRQLLGIEGGEVVTDAAGSDAIIDGDPKTDVPIDMPTTTLHDEDNDGIADSNDNCPTLANSGQESSVGEGVGTACDPRATASGDRIAAFFAFGENMRPNGIMGGQFFEQDHAAFSVGEIATMNQFEITRASVMIANTVVPDGASIELRHGTYQCRIGPCSGSGTLCLRAQGNNSTGETDVVPGPSFRFEIDQTDAQIVCRVVNAVGATTTMADIPSPDDDRLHVRANSVNLTVNSLVLYDAP